jgi:RNA polymerase sigma factor (sigma-70 family)
LGQLISTDWKTLIFDSAWIEGLDKLTKRRFGEGGLAEEASSYVIEKLSVDNWKVFDSFKGQSKPQTFLHSLASNLIEEFSRKRFGRPRPPEWLKRQGNLWVSVWRMLCLERRLPESIVDLLCAEQLREPNSVRTVMQTIKAKVPSCGQSIREQSSKTSVSDDENFAPEDLISSFNTPEAQIENDHFAQVLEMISNLLNGPQFSKSITSETVKNSSINAKQAVDDGSLNKAKALGDALQLEDQEWIILRMVYQDGIKLKIVAQTLGLKDYEPGRIVKRTLQKIRTALVSLGIETDQFSTCLSTTNV